MTGREKLEAAFSSEGTPEIGVVIPYEDIYIRDHWGDLTAKPWWDAWSPDIEIQADWHRDIINAIGQDWVTVPSFIPRDEREFISIEERADGVYRVDRRNGRADKLHPPSVSGWSGSEPESNHPEHIVETIEEIDKIITEAIPLNSAEIEASGIADLSKRLLSEHTGLFPICRVSSPLWSSTGLWSFEAFMTMIVTQPELVKFACKRHLGHTINALRALASLGAKAIWIEECLIDMISPKQYRELNLPVIRELIEAITAAGMKSIYYYCGNPMDRLDDILSAGADALALEEGKKGFSIDIDEIADRVGGRCTLLGNLDAINILQNGTEDDLKREIERQITAGRKNGGRFIMSLGSPVTPETPVERVRLYTEMVREIGVDF